MSGRDGADAPYWEGLEAGRLVLPRCSGCKAWQWPAGRRCGACGSIGLDWIEQPMRATVFSWTRTWHRFAGTESLELPFTSVVAEIEGSGIRLLGRLTDPEKTDPVLGEPLSGRADATQVGDTKVPTIIWSRLS